MFETLRKRSDEFINWARDYNLDAQSLYLCECAWNAALDAATEIVRQEADSYLNNLKQDSGDPCDHEYRKVHGSKTDYWECSKCGDAKAVLQKPGLKATAEIERLTIERAKG